MNRPDSFLTARPLRVDAVVGACFALLLILLGVGCGKPVQPAAASKPAAPKAGPVAAVGETAAPAVGFPRSVFVKNPLKNPFFPSRAEVHQAESAAPPSPADASKQLREKLSAGFMGVMGAGDERMAVINNVILQAGRDAEIPVVLDDGKESVVKVKCLKILRNSVQLKIDGQEKPVTVTLTPKFK